MKKHNITPIATYNNPNEIGIIRAKEKC